MVCKSLWEARGLYTMRFQGLSPRKQVGRAAPKSGVLMQVVCDCHWTSIELRSTSWCFDSWWTTGNQWRRLGEVHSTLVVWAWEELVLSFHPYPQSLSHISDCGNSTLKNPLQLPKKSTPHKVPLTSPASVQQRRIWTARSFPAQASRARTQATISSC